MFCYHHLDRQEERRLIMITSSPSVVWPHWPTSHWGKLSNTGTSQWQISMWRTINLLISNYHHREESTAPLCIRLSQPGLQSNESDGARGNIFQESLNSPWNNSDSHAVLYFTSLYTPQWNLGQQNLSKLTDLDYTRGMSGENIRYKWSQEFSKSSEQNKFMVCNLRDMIEIVNVLYNFIKTIISLFLSSFTFYQILDGKWARESQSGL